MAQKASTKKSDGGTKRGSANKPKGSGRSAASRAVSPRSSSSRGGRTESENGASDMLLKLLESPLVAELIAVGATAALAAVAAQRFRSDDGPRSSRMLKAAGKAAAAAVGARLSTEIDEIKRSARAAKDGAEA